MSLQTADAAITTAQRNVTEFPDCAWAKMFEDIQLVLEADPESAPKIALEFVRRIASSAGGNPADGRGGLAPWQKRKIDRYLRDNLERSIRMDELANEVRLSISHFCRAFKKSFGETPHTHVVRLRLELAQRLMLTTDDPLGQIALSCGLADQAHLSKLFRRTFHDTPNAWRRRNTTDAQAEIRTQVAKAGLRHAA